MNCYDLVKILAKGTFSTVHLAKTKNHGTNIVIKEIHAINADIKSEVDILKSLDHPNIIRYLDSAVKNDTLYIVMEYAYKGTLFQHIKDSIPNRFPPQKVINLFAQIVMAVDHIHSKNIIHRDLKCENIFLTGIYGDVVKIGDFGISKTMLEGDHALTIHGTHNYMAPEIIDGKPYDHKADIWALGCILYELCAMDKLFDGTLKNVILSIIYATKKYVDVVYYGIQIQEMINQMVQLDPKERPDAAAILASHDIFPSLLALGTELGCIKPKSNKKM